MKKVRLYSSTYRKVKKSQQLQPDKPSLTHWVNVLLELGLIDPPKPK